MKKIALPLCSLLCTLLSINLYAQQMDDASMKAWMNYSTPGDMQKMLAKSEGKWVGVVTMWMTPEAEPMEMKCETVNSMELGGRYLQNKSTGNMMGMPFEGWGITGYDNARKIFFSTWIDNMGTGIMYLEGSWDNEKQMMVMTGKGTDPMSGKSIDIKETIQFNGDNEEVMTQYVMMGDKEFKTMEIKFTRQ